MKSHGLTLAITLLGFSFSAYSQKFTFGPAFGTFIQWHTGGTSFTHNVDGSPQQFSIRASQQPLVPFQEGSVGVSGIYSLTDQLSLRAAVTYFPTYNEFIFYNADEVCNPFCASKAAVIGITNLELPVTAGFKMLTIKKFSLAVVAGPSFHLQFAKEHGAVTNTIHWAPGLDKIWNGLDETPKPSVLYLTYGFTLTYGRISLICRQQQNSADTYTNSLEMDGNEYPLHARTRYMNFELSYMMQSFRLKKKSTQLN